MKTITLLFNLLSISLFSYADSQPPARRASICTPALGELAVEEGRLSLRFLIHGDKNGTITATLSDDYETLEFNRAATSAKSQQTTSTETPKPSMIFEPSGTIYPNSCTPIQLDSPGKALAEHSVPEPRSLLRLITVLMCEPLSVDRNKFARAHLPPTLKELADSADGTPSVTLVRSRKEVLESGLFAEGHAWGAELDASNTKVRLSYYQSGACLASRTFTFAKARWMLTETGAACD